MWATLLKRAEESCLDECEKGRGVAAGAVLAGRPGCADAARARSAAFGAPEPRFAAILAPVLAFAWRRKHSESQPAT